MDLRRAPWGVRKNRKEKQEDCTYQPALFRLGQGAGDDVGELEQLKLVVAVVKEGHAVVVAGGPHAVLLTPDLGFVHVKSA